jgi:hypothetical protein
VNGGKMERNMIEKVKEEICVADADAISHYDTLPSLFYLVGTTPINID